MATYQHEHHYEAERSSSAALARVVDSGQRMLRDRLDLLRLEVQETLRGLGRATTLGAAGAWLLALGWVGLAAAATLALAYRMPAAGALAVVGALHFAAGVVVVRVGRTQPHKPRLDVNATQGAGRAGRRRGAARGHAVTRDEEQP